MSWCQVKQRRAQGPAGVARGGLNPQPLEGSLAREAPVGDAVERDPAGEAEVVEPGLRVDVAGDAAQHLLGDGLDGRRQVQLPAGQRRLRRPRRPAEEPLEGRARHPAAGLEGELLEVQPKAAVVLQVDERVEDLLGVDRLPVGCQAHQLVLAAEHLEARRRS
jgi:hypothetical protein